MKATPLVAKATAPKRHTAPNAPDSHPESISLSAEQLNERAVTATRVMTEILERDKNTYSFRHYGINE